MALRLGSYAHAHRLRTHERSMDNRVKLTPTPQACSAQPVESLDLGVNVPLSGCAHPRPCVSECERGTHIVQAYQSGSQSKRYCIQFCTQLCFQVYEGRM